MKPERPHRLLRAIAGVAIIAAFVAFWLHAQVTGESVDTLWHAAFLLLLVAAAIAVFGKDTVDQGLEAARRSAERVTTRTADSIDTPAG